MIEGVEKVRFIKQSLAIRGSILESKGTLGGAPPNALMKRKVFQRC